MRAKRIICITGLMVGICISMLLQTQLNTAMPSISSEFGTTAFYSWVYSGYLLASSVTIPFFGKICERYGYRQNYMAGGIIFFIGTLGSALSPNMLSLVLFRVLTGFGAGIVVPATYGIISVLFKKEDMRKVFGLMTVVQIINKGLGSVLGGFFSTHLTWRVGLLILVPVELLGAIFVYFSTDDNKKMENDSPVNIKSAVLLTCSLLLTMYGLEGLSSNFSIAGMVILAAGAVCVIVFILRERKTENGILPGEILVSPALRGLLLEIFLLGAALNICFVYLPTYMVNIFKWTTDRSGMVLLIYIITMGAASAGAAFIKKESGFLIRLSWGIFILGAALGLLSFPAGSEPLFYIANAILGLSIGILSSVVLGDMQMKIGDNGASTNGIAHLMRNIGGTIGVTAFGCCLAVPWLIFPGLILIGLISIVIQHFLVKKEADR